MFDAQTPGIALTAVCAVILFAILPSALIEAHTRRRTWLSRGDHIAIPPTPRSSLLVEVPIVVVLIAPIQFVIAAVAISPISGLVTRGIAGIELVAFLAWMTYLASRIWRDRSREAS